MVDTSDIQRSMDPEILRSVTDEAGANITTAIESACIWGFVVLKRCAITALSSELAVVKLAIIKRAQYELFSMHEVESAAIDKKEASENMMIGLFGECARFDQAGINDGAAVVAMGVGYDRKLSERVNTPCIHRA
ncbi:MAG: hypothetical protein OMM_13917 [Candidatus Magnetoglobus multicellularis str. Araruama]|uniref:Uncharacterized protein n=1 Tax=Candidatus Magnetoglobus multicellularis str. Araruama TaxID=890399 RepID=A0A1V1NSW3_9BACT|nr:MAG: hypothetical protein OMM_13917 [Candidatus Magnetoglobus multicellularis str. Araruama]